MIKKITILSILFTFILTTNVFADYSSYDIPNYNTQCKNYFNGIIEQNWDKDYLIVRDSEYSHVLIIGNIKYNNNTFTCSDCKYYRYYYQYNNYYITKGVFNGNVNQTSNYAFVYSNVSKETPQAPDIQEKTLVPLLIAFSVMFIYVLFNDLSKYNKRPSKRIH